MQVEGNASQSFADSTAKKVKSVLSGDMCIRKNELASARSVVQLSEKMLAFFRSVSGLADTLMRSAGRLADSF